MSMSNPRISVIVAIYNAEKTLQRLLDSLKAQTMQDFEVLLIDDGSTDSSGSICDGIAASDSRFKVFHKPNEGIGATRQFGIEHAEGVYTIHADSDDWVEPDYLELLYDKAVATGADMVMCDFLYENGKKAVYRKQEPKGFDKDTLLYDLLCRLTNGPCDKLLKRSVYMDYGIHFNQDLNDGEDQLFNLQLVMKGVSVAYVPKALYHYDIISNPESAARSGSLKRIQHEEKFIEELRKLLPENLGYAIDIKNLNVVYIAIRSKAFTAKEFRERYSFLSRVKWKDYRKTSFSINLITWVSLNVSYRLARFLYGVKKTKGRLGL